MHRKLQQVWSFQFINVTHNRSSVLKWQATTESQVIVVNEDPETYKKQFKQAHGIRMLITAYQSSQLYKSISITATEYSTKIDYLCIHSTRGTSHNE